MSKRKKELAKATLAKTFIAVGAALGTGAVGYGTAELVDHTMEHHAKQQSGDVIGAVSKTVSRSKPSV